MSGGTLVREARRRAGLTQGELARRTGTTQSAVARIERGRTEPGLRRVQAMVRACGLDLEFRIVPEDDSNWGIAWGNLQRSLDERVEQNSAWVRFIGEARAARERARERA